MVRFAVTDPSGEIVNVRYQGILPDLFREGQGVVTEGTSRRKQSFSPPTPCSPSMTRHICRRKWPTG